MKAFRIASVFLSTVAFGLAATAVAAHKQPGARPPALSSGAATGGTAHAR